MIGHYTAMRNAYGTAPLNIKELINYLNYVNTTTNRLAHPRIKPTRNNQRNDNANKQRGQQPRP